MNPSKTRYEPVIYREYTVGFVAFDDIVDLGNDNNDNLRMRKRHFPNKHSSKIALGSQSERWMRRSRLFGYFMLFARGR